MNCSGTREKSCAGTRTKRREKKNICRKQNINTALRKSAEPKAFKREGEEFKRRRKKRKTTFPPPQDKRM